MSHKYTVTSRTPRDIEGYSDFCWMEISENKLRKAGKDRALYYFHCSIGGESFAYSYPAVDLLKEFESRGVRLRGEKNKRYSFFIEYPTGRLVRSLSMADDAALTVCMLTPEAAPDDAGSAPSERVTPSEYKAEDVLKDALKVENCEHLLRLVARTSLWATKEEYIECLKNGSTAKHPHIRRKYPYEERGKGDNNTRLDDNSYPNAQMKASLKRQRIKPIGYETCHIWERTCYDPRYHTCYANLVLLPRAIASLSDHNEEVKALLRWYAYERFDHFLPENKTLPPKPENYDEIKKLFKD